MSENDRSSSILQRRNLGGSRREASERVQLRAGTFETTGWSLNRSRGGLRLIVEDAVQQDAVYDLTIGEETRSRRGRVVWIREQADGQIIGIQFVDTPGSVPPPPSDE